MRTLCAFVLCLVLAGHAVAQCDHGYSSSYRCAPVVDLCDGSWHWSPAGWWHGRWYPAGTYRWSACDHCWILQGYGPCYGYSRPY